MANPLTNLCSNSAEILTFCSPLLWNQGPLRVRNGWRRESWVRFFFLSQQFPSEGQRSALLNLFERRVYEVNRVWVGLTSVCNTLMSSEISVICFSLINCPLYAPLHFFLLSIYFKRKYNTSWTWEIMMRQWCWKECKKSFTYTKPIHSGSPRK